MESTVTLPSWFSSYRDHQVTAIDEVMEAFRYSDVVVLDAPTGAGKTLIAETVRQRLQLPAIYTCSTKSLQDQFIKDYPYGRVLKGRSNYPTELYPHKFNLSWQSLSCEDCTKNYTGGSCKWCSSPELCPYEVAKSKALDSELMVVNTSYLLAEANHIGHLSRRNNPEYGGPQLIIADECDLLDEAVTGFVKVEVSARSVKELGIGTPRKVTVPASWLEWLDEIRPVVEARAKEARNQARANPDKRTVSRANYLSRLQKQIGALRQGVEAGGWVYTGSKERVEFKPVWADGVAKEALWRHGKKWLLMSATVISAGQLLSELGWEMSSSFVNVQSTFPVGNRPIYVRPVANMIAKEKDVEWPKLVPEIQRILADHPGERVLIHTHSYELAEYLHRNARDQGDNRPLLTYSSAGERAGKLEAYLDQPGSVLFAPSLDRGIDLPGDACRVQVVAKVPFAYLGDRQIQGRLYGGGRQGQTWYTCDAIRTLVQMCGRGVRSETDTCTTYILDKQFESKLWGFNRGLFPQWWRDALKWRK